MVWDLSFGKPCDHRVLEEILFVVEPSRLVVNLNGQFDHTAPGFILLKNGVDVTSMVVFEVDPLRDKVVYVTGLTFDPAVYPGDDYELGYYAPPDNCPKCFQRST